mmetsp:Transcript_1185/g.3311  ORF Transcript_1185/g.3311 Transcript_1185/m.3311 type:complete len:100 (-) Transcript_1185:3793-4092(-)
MSTKKRYCNLEHRLFVWSVFGTSTSHPKLFIVGVPPEEDSILGHLQNSPSNEKISKLLFVLSDGRFTTMKWIGDWRAKSSGFTHFSGQINHMAAPRWHF